MMARAFGRSIAASALLAVAVSACIGAGSSASAPRLALSACTVQGMPARCGTLQVPENPSAAGGRSIPLRVVVLPARSPHPAPDPLFYLAGGPGGAASDSTAWAFTHFKTLNQTHDIVLVDQRGTGGSNPVICTLAPSAPTEAAFAAVISSCLSSIKSKADPLFYTTPISVDDFDRVRAALGYDMIDLYGGSYGVSSGLAYIQRHGDHVRAALLESGSLLDVHLWELAPVAAQHSLDEVFARCAADRACAAAYPNPKADFAAVTRRLSTAPIPTQMIDPVSGGFKSIDLPTFLGLVIDYYLSDVRVAALLPRDLHRAANGDWSAFSALFTQSASSTSTQMMFLSIVCSDEWAVRDPATVAKIGAASSFTPMSMVGATASSIACKYWPHGSGASGPVQSDAPIVFLNGTADPVDPPANVAGASATMPNSLVVPVTGFGHGVIDQDSSSCLGERANAFIEAGRPSTPAEWACPASLPVFAIQ